MGATYVCEDIRFWLCEIQSTNLIIDSKHMFTGQSKLYYSPPPPPRPFLWQLMDLFTTCSVEACIYMYCFIYLISLCKFCVIIWGKFWVTNKIIENISTTIRRKLISQSAPKIDEIQLTSLRLIMFGHKGTFAVIKLFLTYWTLYVVVEHTAKYFNIWNFLDLFLQTAWKMLCVLLKTFNGPGATRAYMVYLCNCEWWYDVRHSLVLWAYKYGQGIFPCNFHILC